jgi:two-component system sensor histidine kinase DesK
MSPPGPRTGSRSLVLVALACSLVGRAFDAFPHRSPAYLPFVVALFVLPAWYASGRVRWPWERHRWQLLGVQAVLTVVPFILFGDHWVAGVSGLFAGLMLVLLPGRFAWPLYGVLALLEVALWSAVGLPYEPKIASVTWLLVAFVNQSLVLFGLSRLADIVDSLDANRYGLAAAEVARQRLAATRHLQRTVQHRLHRIGELLQAALAADTATSQRVLVSDAGKVAREAGADARRLGLDMPDSAPAGSTPDLAAPVPPRLARGITVGVLVVYATQFLVNVCVPFGSYRPGPATLLGAGLVAVAAFALQLRHTSAELDVRPTGWPWTLAALAVLSVAFYPSAGASSLLFLTFLAASGLLLIRHWSRWALFAGVVVALPVLRLVDSSGAAQTLAWSAYATAISSATSLLVYGLARLTRAADELHGTQIGLAEAARETERLRLARDAHDMLGLGLSTIALKTDLAAALLEQDPDRSHQETVQALHLTRLVDTDVEAVSGDQVSLTLATEVATARGSLAAAGVQTAIEVEPAAGPEADVFAPVLREAVTNVLRHSRASRCTIRLTQDGGAATLVVSNDGVNELAGGEPGRGLVNMSERLHAVRGKLNTRIDGDEFTLTAVVPCARAQRDEQVAVLHR